MIPETRGRKPKYDFSNLQNQEFIEFEFSKSLRHCAMAYAKKKGVKIATRKIGDKLRIYNEG